MSKETKAAALAAASTAALGHPMAPFFHAQVQFASALAALAAYPHQPVAQTLILDVERARLAVIATAEALGMPNETASDGAEAEARVKAAYDALVSDVEGRMKTFEERFAALEESNRNQFAELREAFDAAAKSDAEQFDQLAEAIDGRLKPLEAQDTKALLAEAIEAAKPGLIGDVQAAVAASAETAATPRRAPSQA